MVKFKCIYLKKQLTIRNKLFNTKTDRGVQRPKGRIIYPAFDFDFRKKKQQQCDTRISSYYTTFFLSHS